MISLVVPYYEVDEGKKEVLAKCLASMKGQYDELVLIDEKADNLAYKINKGMSQAKGDFIIVSNDDVELKSGTLKDLCSPDKVTCPLVNNSVVKLFHGHMFCMSRETYKKVGKMHEGYKKVYFDDSDYWMSIESKGVAVATVPGVNIKHEHPGRTIHKLLEGNDVMNDNAKLFVERWGVDAYKRVITIS